MKNSKTHKFGHGKIAKALGNTLKLSSGPDNVRSWILYPNSEQKWPKYIKIFRAHKRPHTIKDNGIK